MSQNQFLIKLLSRRVLLHVLFWTLFTGFYSLGFLHGDASTKRFLFEFVFVILIYFVLIYIVLYIAYDRLFKKGNYILAVMLYGVTVVGTAQAHAECFKQLNDYDISFLNFLPFFIFLSILALALKIFRSMFFELKEEQSKPKKTKEHFVELKKNKSYLQIRPSEVLYLESRGNNVHLFLKNGGEESVYNTLKAVLQKFPEDDFVQIHRSFVVNAEHVSGSVKGFLIIGVHKIPVGQSYSENVESVLR